MSEKSYLWGVNDKLLSVVTDGEETRYEYDGWGNLSKTVFEDGKVEYRNPDRSGNLFESLDRLDRQYARGGQLVKTQNWEYKYDAEGNLVRKKDRHGAVWRYEWNAAGMLEKVKRPDAAEITFRYDALGRRIARQFRNIVTRWWWDGNVPLHEQKSDYFRDYNEEQGEFLREEKQPLVTWIFEEGTFVPAAKITAEQRLSIATNYIGTPEAMYSESGDAVWKCELNSYGKVRKFQGEYKTDCAWRFQGQYEDEDIGLYYNRFRYYSPDEGIYISQDPIRLAGNNPTLYGYVKDPNSWVDVFGLAEHVTFPTTDLHPTTVTPTHPDGTYVIQATGSYQKDKEALYGKAELKESFSSDYISHHVSYNPDTNEMTMQLVKEEPHRTTSHVGGADDFLMDTGLKDEGLKYGSIEAIEEAKKRQEESSGCKS